MGAPEDLELQLAQWQANCRVVERRRHTLALALVRASDDLVALHEQVDEQAAALERRAAELDAARRQAHELRAAADAMAASRSWRLTAPLRRVGELARRRG